MNIVVTGSTGLVGQTLKKLVTSDENNIDNYIFLSSTDYDLKDCCKVDELFTKYKPDIVIHCANIVAGLYGNIDNNYFMLIDNLKINTNILESCRKYNIKRLINILSTCVFPENNKFNNLTYPLSSNQILNGKPHYSNNGYSHSKRMLYVGSKLLVNISNIEIVNLIPTNLYGEYDNYHLQKSHVISGLIHKTYLAKQNNTNLIIKGSGTALRQFLYADDFAKIINYFTKISLPKQCCSLIVSPHKKDIINIKQLVSKLVNILEFKGKIIFDTDYSDGQNKKITDSNELLHYIPDFKFTSFSNGLYKTINHFVTNFPNVRK